MRVCAVENCAGTGKMRLGLCSRHYQRAYAHGSVEPIVRERRRQQAKEGDRRLHSRGYLMVFAGGSWHLEHRYVMEQMLGRPLLPNEQVHHRDGDKHNNNSSNLELWLTGQPTGIRVDDAVEWAKTILERYAA